MAIIKRSEKLKIYLDTTIPNYVFASHLPEKQEMTVKLFKEIQKSKHIAFVSDVVLGEIDRAERPLRDKLLKELNNIEILQPSIEAENLALRYIEEEIIPRNYADDARHVAIATVNNLDAVVSWNCNHLVKLSKIKKINELNGLIGYKRIELVTPEEVIEL